MKKVETLLESMMLYASVKDSAVVWVTGSMVGAPPPPSSPMATLGSGQLRAATLLIVNCSESHLKIELFIGNTANKRMASHEDNRTRFPPLIRSMVSTAARYLLLAVVVLLWWLLRHNQRYLEFVFQEFN